MNNSKKNVHNSGPLGMLIKSGQIKRIDLDDNQTNETQVKVAEKATPSYFKTKFGVDFHEQELCFVDPKECEPWKYANRHIDEMGDMDELIESIRQQKQLQPALVRVHQNPHHGIKYEVIFGRRRHAACLKLGIPFLVIKKEFANIQDAIAAQDAENQQRNDVSNYSNALLYKRLLDDSVFSSEKELAAKLMIPRSSLNDLMAFTKLPTALVNVIPDIHCISKYIAVKLVALLKQSDEYLQPLVQIAKDLGVTITSPAALEQALEKKIHMHATTRADLNARVIISTEGKKLFTYAVNSRGTPTVMIQKDMLDGFDPDAFCDYIKKYFTA